MLKNYLFKSYSKFKLSRFNTRVFYGTELQERILKNILLKNKDTYIGEKYHFDKLKFVDQYRESVPVHCYSNYHSYLEESQNKMNILTKEPIIYWARTSGSSGTPKLIPHTKTSIKNWNEGAIRNYISYLANTKKRILTNNFIAFVGPSFTKYIHNIPVGYISGIAAKENKFLSSQNVVPEHLNNINNFDDKLLQITKYAINNKINGIVGITSFSLHLLHFIKFHSKDWVKYNKEVSFCLDENGDINLNNLWPDFGFMLSTGVMKSEFQSKINYLIDNVWVADFYAGTEGAYAFTNNKQDNGMTLNIDLYFFEFRDLENGEIYSLKDAQLYKPYEVIITAPNGLYRFTNEDIVELVSLCPPQIKVLGRTTTMINIAGEKLNELEIAYAVNKTLEKYGLTGERFVFFGWNDDQLLAHHCLAIELFNIRKEPVKDFINHFVEVLSKNRYSYYKGLQSIIKPANIIILKPGTFEQIEKNKAAESGFVGHSKVKTIIDLETACKLIKSDHILFEDLPYEIRSKFKSKMVDEEERIL
ncbi:GH3 family domain-containing protein [Niallia sp. 01092]|uniref:GH3 family domain-containing protein n=1 Tax=unclassified Niallia TaxID=2837522 RepID=UPI003FD33888